VMRSRFWRNYRTSHALLVTFWTRDDRLVVG
jgi:hypothetical protein